MSLMNKKIRDGVFVGTSFESNGGNVSPEELELYADSIFGLNEPEYLFNFISKEIDEIISDNLSSKARKSNAKAALLSLYFVRNNLENGTSKDTFINTYHMMNFLWKAKIRPFEGGIFHKKHLSELGKKGNAGYSESRDEVHKYWQDQANEIKNQHCTWSKWRIAGEISEKTGENRRTINKNINV